jgi:hypothetical protein
MGTGQAKDQGEVGDKPVADTEHRRARRSTPDIAMALMRMALVGGTGRGWGP